MENEFANAQFDTYEEAVAFCATASKRWWSIHFDHDNVKWVVEHDDTKFIG